MFRVETTLLPDTRIIEWKNGQCVRTLVSQYVAYLDGRIEEVALDFYAQADDGSVWYFGEDVYNYAEGVIRDTSGTWLAGKEGPAAMIMPAAPKVGEVHRPENIPGLVFEEVAVKAVDKTMAAGPRGAVRGALVGRELHDDGTFSDKVFAPGYGEFFTAHEGDVEALALAVPTAALAGPPPNELRRLRSGANAIFAARDERWKAAPATVASMKASWSALRARGVPPRLAAPTDIGLASLSRAVAAHNSQRTRNAALDMVQAALDLELSYRSPAQIDRARFDLWLRQALVDATSRDRAAVSGDLATLEWIRDRIAQTFDSVTVTRLDTHLEKLRDHVGDNDLRAVARTATALRKMLAATHPRR